MKLILPLALIGVPLIEIALFVKAGEALDLWVIVAIVVATAMLGATMLRRQGRAALARAQASLSRGEPPRREIFDALCLLAAALLLITPGFLTDALGLLLFAPPVRAALRALARRMLMKGAASARFAVHIDAPGPPDGDAGKVVDADFEVIDDEPEPPP